MLNALRSSPPGLIRARVFTDKLSGSVKTARPGLAAMLDYARAGDTVVVAAIDRLGRSVAEVTRTIATLGERRITLRALREGIDTGVRSWPSTSDRHDCAAPYRTETRAPACTPRTAPTTRRSAPGTARRTRHRRRRSRTPDPPATPTRPRGPHAGSAREKQSSGRTGPASSKPATYVRTPQPPPQTNPELSNLHQNRPPPPTLSRPVEDCAGCCPRLLRFAI